MAETQPIIIKRVKKHGHEGHHGGAWKVAYADFVTAMMAFFLLLWLLNSVTEEQMVGIADYFTPTAISNSSSGSGGILGGATMLSPGAMESPKSAPGVTVSLLPLDESIDPDYEGKPEKKPKGEVEETELSGVDVENLREQLEQQEFEKAEAALREAIDSSPDLREFSKNLLVDMTPEGMRIQITDADQRSMFPSGSSTMYDYTELLLQKIVQTILKLPNDIAVIGHTDATPFHSRDGYTNWELSTDRANASRRALVGGGLPDWRIVRVVGKSAHEPLLKDDPYSPENRRISIILLRENRKRDEG